MQTYFEVTSLFLSRSCIYLHPHIWAFVVQNQIEIYFTLMSSSAGDICVKQTSQKRFRWTNSDIRCTKSLWTSEEKKKSEILLVWFMSDTNTS